MPEQKSWRLLQDVLSGRISSGFDEFDTLLLGGIPEKHSIIIVSTSCDERDFLVERFLEFGSKAEEMTFFVSIKVGESRNLAGKYPEYFHFFICNSKIDPALQNLPNVIKLKDVENLTEIDIAISKAFNALNLKEDSTKRACIEILSDVLLHHRVVITRKWLNELLTDLKSKGFTTLATIDPNIHSKEEIQAITDLFDGEIRISEKETGNGVVRRLRINKLTNKRYSEKELVLTKEKIAKRPDF